MNISIVILAAGEGTRMNSSLAKVLHPLGGKPLLAHVVETAQALSPQHIFVVYSKQRPEVKTALPQFEQLIWVEQEQQLGTANAVACALPNMKEEHRVLILYGDVPLVSVDLLQCLLETDSDAVAWLTAIVDDPEGLGRIVRDDQNQPLAIIEQSDLARQQQVIKEINSGICLLPVSFLKQYMETLSVENNQHEYYLTDFFALAVEKKKSLTLVNADQPQQVLGVNNCQQLAVAERIYQQQQAERLMQQGVTLKDPSRFDLRGILHCQQDVIFDVNVIVEGKVLIGQNVLIEANVVLRDVTIGDNVIIRANSVITQAVIDDHCQVGPFAHIRPKTVLKSHSKIGNFVEVKNSTVGQNSKANHLTYLGDAKVGKAVNIGAGTITCNYDGVSKHQTVIEDDVFVGSNNSLVAPIHIGKGATTGAGSALSKTVPAQKLTIGRSKAVTISAWKRPQKPKIDS